MAPSPRWIAGNTTSSFPLHFTENGADDEQIFGHESAHFLGAVLGEDGLVGLLGWVHGSAQSLLRRREKAVAHCDHVLAA